MKPSAQPGSNADAALSQAIDHLWARFLPEIRERVTVLESAAAAVARKKLTASAQEAAHAAAHKLAGVLGTFSLTRGTTLARELEMTYARETAPGPAAAKRLSAIAAELRSMIEGRSSQS